MKFVILAILGIACSSRPGMLSEKGKDLEVYSSRPAGCHVVGKVVGVNDIWSTEMATNDALNQAAKLKATGIFVDQEVPNGKSRAVHATAYHCP